MERSHQEREDARQLLLEARQTDQVIELTLEPEEREPTIKLRYRAVAKEESLTIQFHIARRAHDTEPEGRDGDSRSTGCTGELRSHVA